MKPFRHRKDEYSIGYINQELFWLFVSFSQKVEEENQGRDMK
jgi:hypothetical protein